MRYTRRLSSKQEVSDRRLVCLLLLAAGPAVPSMAGAQELPAVTCDTVKLVGKVLAGEQFEAPFSPRLHFRLAPTRQSPPNPSGWTIEVRSVDKPEREYSWVATPPYRFSNARYVDTGYGVSAEAAVQVSERSFSFVLNDKDYETMAAAVRVLLWPGDQSKDQLEDARRTLSATPVGSGIFRILDSRVDAESEGSPLGRIVSLSFETILCTPST
jgi:hypothetical protein